jgi:uncharacterized membrane protein
MNESNKLSYTRMIAISGIMGAITVLLLLTPLGFIPWITGLPLTIMQVPTIVAAILGGPIAGLIVGAIFGVSSLLKAAIAPITATDPFFVNPILSVIPRLVIGPVSYFVYKALKGKESKRRIILGAILASIAGSLTNTCLVLPLFKFFVELQTTIKVTWRDIGIAALGNGLPEAGISAFIATATVLSWKAITIGRSKARLADEDGNKG